MKFLTALSILLISVPALTADLRFECRFNGAVRPQYKKVITGNLTAESTPVNVKVVTERGQVLVTERTEPKAAAMLPGDPMATDYRRFDVTDVNNPPDPRDGNQYFLVLPIILANAPGALFSAGLDEEYAGGDAGWNRFDLRCKIF